MLRTLLRLAALALLAEGSVTRRLLTSWLGPRTKGELAARSAAASELYLLRGGSTKTRKKKKAKKKVVVEEDEDEDEDEEAFLPPFFLELEVEGSLLAMVKE